MAFKLPLTLNLFLSLYVHIISAIPIKVNVHTSLFIVLVKLSAIEWWIVLRAATR